MKDSKKELTRRARNRADGVKEKRLEKLFRKLGKTPKGRIRKWPKVPSPAREAEKK